MAWIAANWPMPALIAGSRRTPARVTAGATCLSSSSHLPLMPYSKRQNRWHCRLAAPSCRQSRRRPDRHVHEHDRHRASRLQQWCQRRAATGQNDVRGEGNQLGYGFTYSVGIAGTPAILDPHVATDVPAQLLQALVKCCDAGRRFAIVRGERHENADTPHSVRLLRPRRERPSCRGATQQRDELAPLSIIRSPRQRGRAALAEWSGRALWQS